MNKKINVLFVCIANSCRSQMAEALFNELSSNYAVDTTASSAGTVPADEVNPSALEVLKELNIDHHSDPKILSDEMMSEADVIISMDAWHQISVQLLLFTKRKTGVSIILQNIQLKNSKKSGM
ncbi:MAG: hypothetical protein AAEA79_01865 [Nitrososphaerales archaeon]